MSTSKVMKLTITGCVYSLNFIITPKPNVNSLHGIVAYTSTFVNIYENIHQFLSSIERDEQERKLVPFFCVTVYIRRTDKQADGETPDRRFTLAAVMNAASAKCTL